MAWDVERGVFEGGCYTLTSNEGMRGDSEGREFGERNYVRVMRLRRREVFAAIFEL